LRLRFDKSGWAMTRRRAATAATALGLMVVLALGWSPALAQVKLAGLPAQAAPASPAAPALTPAETKQMIDLLNDPQKRAAFTATLQTLAKASAAVAPPAAASPVPLAPDSVGAQVLSEGSTWLTGLSHQFATLGHGLSELPALLAFTNRAATDPAMRATILDAAWHMAAVLAAAALAEWIFVWLLRRPIRALARHAPENEEHGKTQAAHETRAHARMSGRGSDHESLGVEADEGFPAARAEEAALVEAPLPNEPQAQEAAALRKDNAVERIQTRRRFSGMMRGLRRLPFVVIGFLLDVMPLGVFLAVAYAGALFVVPRSQAMLQAAILAYAVCRVAACLTRALVAPAFPSLRLLPVSDDGAAYVLRWIRRVFAVGAFGFAATQIGALFGVPAAANDAFLKAVFLVVHVFLIIIVLQCRASVADRIRSHREVPGIAGLVRNRLAAVWHLIAIFYIAALWLVWAAEIRHGYLRIWHLFLVSAGVIIATRLVAIAVLGGLDRSFRGPADGRHAHPALRQSASRYYPLLRGTVTAVLVVAGGLGLLESWGVDTLAWFRANALGGRLVSASASILIAGAVALTIWESVNLSIERHLARLTREAQMVKSARLRTLQPIMRTLLLSTLIGIFGLTALSEIGVDIAPLLAGAGILGVAIGFGSQKLVQDFITGIFLLLENAMQVGDWVTVAGLSGSVENLSIRTMRLRAADGSVHIIPFSSVSTVTNVNRGIGNAAVSVNVEVEEDTDRVCDVLTEIARKMRGERRYADMMRSELQLWGVDKVDAGVANITGQIVCTDSGRWPVQREFNRRMIIRFKELGIRVATPVQTIYNYQAPQPENAAQPVAQLASKPPAPQIAAAKPPSSLGKAS
jgi:small-conductance mechanosensitive channel